MNSSNRKKVYVIDPNNTVEYIYGLLKELSDLVDVTYVTKKSSNIQLEGVKIKRMFYSDTNQSRIGMGLNYLFVYLRLLIYSLFGKVDVFHIQWCKLEKVDPFFIRLLRIRSKVVLTAHNVLPHVNGDYKKNEYKKIYDAVDKIIVHGDAIRRDLLKIFPNSQNKIYIQPYGFCMLELPPEKLVDNLIDDVMASKKQYSKIVMCLGLINKYKGTDRILKIWNNNFCDKQYLLVIAGKVIEKYEELNKEIVEKAENVWIRNRHLTDYEFKRLSELADIIVLPYRNASMSGVIYAAARASTAILTTGTGTIPEYLENGNDSLIVDNNDDNLYAGLSEMLSMDKEELNKMGKCLHNNFMKKYDWKSIVYKLVEECY